MNSKKMVNRRISNVIKTVKNRELNPCDPIHDDYDVKKDNINYSLIYSDDIVELNIDNSEDIQCHLARTKHIINSFTSIPSFLMTLRYHKRL